MTVIEQAPAATAGWADPVVAAKPRKSLLRRRRHLVAWLFMAPLLVINGGIIVVPGLMNVYYSFTDWSGVGGAKWIGVHNYARMLTDPDFLSALIHNLIWTLIFMVVPMTMALVGAFILSRLRRFVTLFRLIYFTPYIVATVVSTSIWQYLLSPDYGVTPALARLGIPGMANLNLLGEKSTALGAVAAVNVWAWWGFLLTIFLSAMQSVNTSLYEAAQLDGAGPWRQFVSVTLPSIRPTLMFLSLMTIIWSFLVFDWVFILTSGGPGGATEVLGTLLYKSAFDSREAGYAAAIGVVMALVSALVVGGYLYLKRKRDWDI